MSLLDTQRPPYPCLPPRQILEHITSLLLYLTHLHSLLLQEWYSPRDKLVRAVSSNLLILPRWMACPIQLPLGKSIAGGLKEHTLFNFRD